MKCLIILLVILFLPLAPLWGQDFEHVSSTLFHDKFYSVVTVGDYVYCGGLYGLQIFSIADSANPVLVKNCDIPYIGKIVVDGTNAFVMKSAGGYNVPDLRIYDLSEPLNPDLLGNYDSHHGSLGDIEIYDNIAFIPSEVPDPYFPHSITEVIDVSDPSNPVLVDSLVAQLKVTDIYAKNGLLFILSHEFDFWYIICDIYELTNPAHPHRVSSLDFPPGNPLRGVSSSGNYAYIITVDGIHIYNISEGFDLEGVYIPEYYTDRIIIDDQIAYLYGDSRRICILDLSDPVNPVSMGILYSSHNFMDLCVAGDTSFSLSRFSSNPYAARLDVIDFSDPYDPDIIGYYYPPGRVYDVQLYDDYAYIANGVSGLQVIDISDPQNPQIGNRYDTVREDIDIFIDGHYAYIVNDYIGLKIFDLTNPADPVQIGMYNNMDEMNYIFADSTFAYIIAYQSTAPAHLYVSILDISDSSEPFEVNSIHNLYWPRYIHVVGNYAYISCRYSMEIFDVSDPYSIRHLGSHQYLDRSYHLFVEPPYAYVASSPHGLEIIDVSDPENPYLVGSCDSLSAYHVSVRDGYAYLSGNNRLQLIDISNPAAPAVISVYSPSGDWLSGEVFLQGDYIYDAAHSHFQILKLTETGIEEVSAIYPSAFSLSQNYPNPFNASTTIRYALPKEAAVTIEIYDILGRRIETLVPGKQPAGSHTVVWEAEDVPSGVYFYRIEAGEYSQTQKCVLLK